LATTRNKPEPEVSKRDRAEDITRTIIAGHEDGAVRRILIYVVAIVSLTLITLDAQWAIVPAFMAVALLLATDGSL